jgi:hypothetical protein
MPEVCANLSRTHLKNVFWPPAFFGGIGASFQILDNHQVACGLKLGPAAILNQNFIFETGSSQIYSGAGSLPYVR